MGGIIIDLTATGRKSTLARSINAHTRNAKKIADILGYKHITSEELERYYTNKKYENIVFDYASSRMPIKSINKFLDNNKSAKIYWLINDYKEVIPSFLVGRDVTAIGNNEKIINNKHISKGYCVNLNAILTDFDKIKNKRKYDIIYYGTFRKNREKYFKEYLMPPVILSTSKQNRIKYKKIGCDSKVIDKLSWDRGRETLRLFKFSLIIEDEKSHRIYSHAPNRLYESILCGTIPLVDRSMKKNIEKSGLKLPGFCYISSHQDLVEKIKQYNDKIADHIYEDNIVTIKQQKDLAIKAILDIFQRKIKDEKENDKK